MANIKIGLLVSDDTSSMKKRKNEAEQLNKELQKTQALSKSAIQPKEVVGYNQQRSIVGTGASARDFANQAQGMGGVVRLYATFAANIFAVTAAYQALNRAAQMDRLIQASEIMSQRTGVNLKRLGQNLQEATGYAISFEESMRFANVGVSAGIAAKDLKELVTIAKGAAAGLGRDVNDSITRIIQGTAKQEQEILDELGIFIKAKDAYEQYAQRFQIEGGADALSAQQRVVAYSDAVIKAGQQWKEFAKIPDPFAELTARGQEALQKILSSANQIVVPVLEILAKSSSAVQALILLIGGTLVKRALPELGSALTQIFTYEGSRKKAEADKARAAIVADYNKTTQQLTEAKTIRDKLMVDTFTGIGTALGPQAGVRATKDQPGVAGISAQRLTTAIFGTEAAPKDLSKLKSAEDVNNRILTTLKSQVKATKNQDDFVQKLIQNKVLEAKSTKDNLILTQQIQQVGSTIYTDIVSKRIKAQKDLLDLTAREADLSRQIQGFQAGITTTVTARRTATAGAGAAAGTAAGTAATAAAATAASVSLRDAFSAGLGQAGDRSRELASQLDQGPIRTFKAFTSAIGDNLKAITTAGQGLGFMARSAAMAGAAVGALGTVVSGAFRLIGAAFGPVMIIFTLWELFGDKIIPENTKKTNELNTKIKELTDSLTNSNKALTNAAIAYENSTKGPESYLAYVQTTNTALRTQIASIQEIVELEKEKARIARGEKPETEAERQKRLLGTRVGIGAEDRAALQRQLDAIIKMQEPPRGTQVLSTDARQKILDEFNRQIRVRAYGLEIEQKLLDAEMQEAAAVSEQAKNEREDLTRVLNKIRSGELKEATTNAPRQFMEQASTVLGGPAELARRIAKAEADVYNTMANARPGDSEAARAKAWDDYSAALQKALAKGQQLEASVSGMSSKMKDAATAGRDLAAEMRKIPELSGVGKTPEAMKLEGAFKELYKPQATPEQQKATVEGIKEVLDAYGQFDSSARSLRSNIVGMDAGKFLEEAARGKWGTQFKDVLESVNEATSEYNKTARLSFIGQQKEIDNTQTSLINLNTAQDKQNNLISIYTRAGGSATRAQITSDFNLRKTALELQYNLTQKTAQLDRDRVLQNKKTTEEEKDIAKAKYDTTMQQADANKQAAIARAEQNKSSQELEARLNEINIVYENQARAASLEAEKRSAIFDLESSRLSARIGAGALYENEAASLQYQLNLTKANFDLEVKLGDLNRQKAKEELEQRALLASDAGALVFQLGNIDKKYRDQKTAAEAILQTRKEQLEVERKVAELNAKIKRRQELEVSRPMEDRTAAREFIVEYNDVQTQLLEKRREDREISEKDYLITKKQSEEIRRQLDYGRKRDEIESRFLSKRIELEEKMTTLGDTPALKEEVGLNEARRTRDLEYLNKIKEAQDNLAASTEYYTERQKGWGQAIEGFFSNMTSEFENWVKTGTFSSKKLFDSLLADIARYELKLIMLDKWASIRKPVLDFIGSMFGSPASAGASTSLYSLTNQTTPQLGGLNLGGTTGVRLGGGGGMALGMSYNTGGVEYFAKGGTFTNSIVNSPTLFKAAKGIGVMGEAGPEAIMPLKRDGNGNLGVRGGGSNVAVVINNYSSEKASSKEVVDSRGNKSIEVTIGDAVSAQLTKTGSNMQRSMSSTYGMRPQLIRR